MKSNNFQIIVIIIFLAAGVFGVMVFAGIIKIGDDKNKDTGPAGTVTIWGTERSRIINPLIEDVNEAYPNIRVRYVGKSKDTFDRDILEAIAIGAGPDLILIPDSLAFSYSNKIYKVPFTSYPEVSFTSTFAPAGEVFLANDGIFAFPLLIDPLVMYYDRSLLDANGIVYPPAYWDDITAIVPLLTKRDAEGQVTKSAVALGQFSNITNAKDILVTLFMQMGSNIVTEKRGYFAATLDEPTTNKNLRSILGFYLGFADPLSSFYSWNKSLPNSDVAFSAGNVGFYFGFASELEALIRRNPNQNFAVAPVPQIKNANTKVVRGKVTGLAISSFSKNKDLALIAAQNLSMGDFAQKLSTALNTPPARRDLLNATTEGVYNPIFYKVALYSKSWLDPSPINTDNVFKNMVESVLSNSSTVEQALKVADNNISLFLLK